jgi:type I restriction enzyme M protein
MLDSITKKRIDDLRNILVGKIPSPQSQVEQITTGLIYKFMYDMDQEAVDMGGVPSFFVNDYEKYSWKNLFDPKLSGVQKVQLYGDAIEHMYTNPTAPQLFREIFKNSFLPFKDPATLNMFLKEINEFHYSHSEKLGDAFEYLLSFMGSQGDAGQFRTPRHIIDFIVDIVNPHKNESVLDPACGTAGFLISSYKHILEKNTDKKIGDRLTASDRKQIGENLVGYDISPDMTRISLVNMYLHQFASPQIHEYDTLSSEDRWNEYYDVILANPPFFSPTGGIQPHSRFGVQSTRAEILFVDYIMSHLKPKGRAGIIVPEGIIFNPENAFKTIRKNLLESGLVGVISLPAGIFNPYSDNKTSILIIDKELSRKFDSVFFAKINSDGFSLGKNRKAQGTSDLPLLSKSIKEIFLNQKKIDCKNIQYILKEKIKSQVTNSYTTGNYVFEVLQNKYPLAKIEEVANININSGDPNTLFPNGSFVYIDIGSVENGTGKVSLENVLSVNDAPSRAKRLTSIGDTIVSTVRPNLKGFAYIDFDTSNIIVSTGFLVLTPRLDKILPEFLYHCVFTDYCVQQMIAKMERGNYPSINQTDMKQILIPLPTIEEQKIILKKLTVIKNQVTLLEENIIKLKITATDLINSVWAE